MYSYWLSLSACDAVIFHGFNCAAVTRFAMCRSFARLIARYSRQRLKSPNGICNAESPSVAKNSHPVAVQNTIFVGMCVALNRPKCHSLSRLLSESIRAFIALMASSMSIVHSIPCAQRSPALRLPSRLPHGLLSFRANSKTCRSDPETAAPLKLPSRHSRNRFSLLALQNVPVLYAPIVWTIRPL